MAAGIAAGIAGVTVGSVKDGGVAQTDVHHLRVTLVPLVRQCL